MAKQKDFKIQAGYFAMGANFTPFSLIFEARD
jgi:hypothetical protein